MKKLIMVAVIALAIVGGFTVVNFVKDTFKTPVVKYHTTMQIMGKTIDIDDMF